MGLRPKYADEGVATTESLTHEGLGVAHVDGKATFIHGALPGEQVRFRYYNKRPRYDLGVTLEVLKPAAARVTPPCPHFGVCGGCTLQHCEPASQIAEKERILRDTLAHVGGLCPAEVLPPITGPTTGYRRRARLGARLVPKKGGVLVGFREKNSSYITPLSECLVLDPRVARWLPDLASLIAALSIPDRIPQIEVALGDDEGALVFRHLAPLSTSDEADLRAFGARTGLAIYVQPEGPDSVRALTDTVDLMYRQENGVAIHFGPTDFVQVNAAVNRALTARVLALLAPAPGDRIVDFFCGLGNFSLPMAATGAAVVGVEASHALVARAQANAQRQAIAARFEVADLYQAPGENPWWNGQSDKVLLDPPRSGAIELVKTFDATRIRRIVYVSCYPPTLARDCEYLVQVGGYRLVAAGVADMFPHTTHVESYAYLEA